MTLEDLRSWQSAKSNFVAAWVIFGIGALPLIGWLTFLVWFLSNFAAFEWGEPALATNVVLLSLGFIAHGASVWYLVTAIRRKTSFANQDKLEWVLESKRLAKDTFESYSNRLRELSEVERQAIANRESVQAGKGILVMTGPNFALYTNWLDSSGPSGSIRGANASFTDTTNVSQIGVVTGAYTLFARDSSGNPSSAATFVNSKTRTMVAGSVSSLVTGPQLIPGTLIFPSAEVCVAFANELNKQASLFDANLEIFPDFLAHSESQLEWVRNEWLRLNDWFDSCLSKYTEEIQFEMAVEVWGHEVADLAFARKR